MSKLVLKSTFIASLIILLTSFVAVASGAPNDLGDEQDSSSLAIIQRYLQAQQTHEDALRGASMQVDIDAAIPGLKEHGKLRALRKISKLGQVTYRQLGFQGDNSVKKDVIARYLQAEQQGQGDQNVAITPDNYKFKFKGTKSVESGNQVFVFQLTPRKKKVGLFKGSMWVDRKTYLLVMEKGRLVRNPSIFFKTVDFERRFAIRDGVAVPSHMTIDSQVRLVGRVELSIDYSNYEQNGADTDESQSASMATAGAQ